MGTWPAVASGATWVAIPVIFLLTLSGFGSWAVRDSRGVDGLAMSSLAGALTVMSGFGLLHMFTAVPRSVTVPLVLTGFVLFLRQRSRRHLDAPSLAWALSSTLLIVAAYRVAALPHRTGRKPRLHYDALLYHGGLVEWFDQSPLPFGLGLLHSRFGFNPGITQLMAAFRAPSGSWSHHLIVEVLVVAIALLLTLRAFFAARDSSDLRGAGFILGLLIFSLGFLVMTAPRAGTDLAAAVTAIAAVAAAVIVSGHRDPERAEAWLGILLMLVALAIVQKTSMIAVVMLLAAPFSQASTVRRDAWSHSAVWIPASLAGACGAIWLARSFVISGCFAYPVGISCSNVIWGVGASAAEAESRVIRSWARTGTTSDSVAVLEMSWLTDWLSSYLSGYSLALVGLVFVGLLVRLFSVTFLRTSPKPQMPVHGRILTSYVITTFVIWFFGAPDPRFAIHLHIILAALLASPALTAVVAAANKTAPDLSRTLSTKTFLSFAVVACSMTIALLEVIDGSTFPVSGVANVDYSVYSAPVVSSSADTQTNTETWQFLVPENGDQCGNAVPCSPTQRVFDVSITGRRVSILNRN